jgi:hypothetical protein
VSLGVVGDVFEVMAVGEFRKTRHPWNIEFNEVLEICFSGAGHSRFSEI